VLRLASVLATCALVVPEAAARPPFPHELELAAGCEHAQIATEPASTTLTSCVLTAHLRRAGPATLLIELAAAALDDGDERGVVGATLGLDLNLGREKSELGLDLVWRMSVLAALGPGGARAEPYPFTYGGLRLGLGWQWLELGGSPWPRPGDPRVLHIGYGIDAHHWIGAFGLGLFGHMAPSGERLARAVETFGAYGEITGRVGDLRLGVRAVLGGWQGLQLTLGGRFDLL